ncbi:ABC transporter ATP-binding protein/permease [Ornithinimicrobium sp. Arc0846-15]|nr:ABC transporter ATP-binding protein/permease [Ornithinimicrobium laminariae]
MKFAIPSSPGNAAARGLSLPAGVGVLFDRAARRKLSLAVIGLVVTGLLEIVALLSILPLMQLLSGAQDLTGWPASVGDFFGASSTGQLAGFFAVLVIGAYTIKAVFTVAFRWWFSGVMADQEVATAAKLFRYYTRAPYPLHLRRTSSELVSIVNSSVSTVYGSVVAGSLMGLAELVTIFSIATVLLVLAPIPALVAVAFFGVVSFVFQLWSRPRLATAGEVFIRALQDALRSAVEAIETIKEVQVRGSGDFFEERYSSAREASAQAARRKAFYTEFPKYVMEVLFVLGIGLLTWVAFASTGSDALAIVALFAAAGFRVLPSVVRAIASFGMVRSGEYPLRQVIADVRLSDALEAGQQHRGPKLKFEDSLAIAEVSFRYAAEAREVLRGVSIDIPFGASVALVGSSGAGKSTLVDLVLGLLEPTAGRIEVDGVNISERQRSWQDNIGLVPQSVALLEGSVRENVALASLDEEIDDDRVWEVLRAADLHTIVQDMPGGLGAPVGERGVRFSGGQKQRIGIARALYRNPRILVLDEATSALDNATERKITDTILGLRGSMTVLVVAHRLSTVKRCDQIVFMNNGQIDARGTFDELNDRNPEFAHLVSLGALT